MYLRPIEPDQCNFKAPSWGQVLPVLAHLPCCGRCSATAPLRWQRYFLQFDCLPDVIFSSSMFWPTGAEAAARDGPGAGECGKPSLVQLFAFVCSH